MIRFTATLTMMGLLASASSDAQTTVPEQQGLPSNSQQGIPRPHR